MNETTNKKNQIVLIVPCGKQKSAVACKAKNMYNSFRFQEIKKTAENLKLQWYILSAKYGIVSPDEVIQPYDMLITSCSEAYRCNWAKEVTEFMEKYCDSDILLLASKEYACEILPIMNERGFQVSAPFCLASNDAVTRYMEKAQNLEDVKKAYQLLSSVAQETCGIRRFRECDGRMYWPNRGVYFVVDFNERSIFSDDFPRIVRVGTHAIARGSKSTLWQRLKAHKGTNDGGGNHRGSVFRLHIGNALMKKESLYCETWGRGQVANREMKSKEMHIERMVSEYIGNLGVVVIDVDDLPAPTSARAFIERNAIALLSSANGSFNFSKLDWLGNYSSRREIEDSCLWNVNHINDQYDHGFIDALTFFSENTVLKYEREK